MDLICTLVGCVRNTNKYNVLIRTPKEAIRSASAGRPSRPQIARPLEGVGVERGSVFGTDKAFPGGGGLTFLVVEVAEEGDKLLLVLSENVQNGFCLVGVGHENLEDMEGLKLDVLALVPQ